MVKMLSKLWGIFTGLIIIGIIVYIGLLWVTSQSITAQLKSIETIKYSANSNKITVCFKIQVNNTGYIDVNIEKLYYQIYINGKYLGEGTKENLVISRGVNNIDICLVTTPSDILRVILVTALLHREKVNVTIKGYIDIPIKSFGIIKLWSLELPYEETYQINLSK
jgi:LEA14-like dessication related protein